MTSKVPKPRIDEIYGKLEAVAAARAAITAQDVCDLAVRWLERDYRGLVDSNVVELADEELARVVTAYLDGTASAEDVATAAGPWRARFSRETAAWLDGWDAFLIQAVDARTRD